MGWRNGVVQIDPAQGLAQAGIKKIGIEFALLEPFENA